MNYSVPLVEYLAKLQAARVWACARCGGPLPAPHYTLVCEDCQKRERRGTC